MNILNAFDSYLNQIKPSVKTGWDQFVQEKQKIKWELESLGFPKRKEESWKNTSLKFLNDYSFNQEQPSSAIITTKAKEEIKTILNHDFYHVVLVNGAFCAELSQWNQDEALVIKSELTSAVFSDRPENKSSFSFSRSFELLNSLYHFGKTSIQVKANKKPAKPLQILNYVYSEAQQSLNTNPQISLMLESGSKAEVLLTYQGPQGIKYFTNAHFEATISENASLELVNETKESYQAFHLDQNQITLAKNSYLKYLDFNLKSQIARHELVVNLDGEGAVATVLGATLSQMTEHCDHQTKIHFKKSHTTADQLYKSILDNESRCVFSGTVFIDKNIEQVNSTQLNNNLLISEKAEANSKPVLMIYSDDVKASHGSTVGQLNPEELYYLQTRSISKERAIELLSVGFLLELVEKLEAPSLRSYLTLGLNEKFLSGKNRPVLKNLK